MAGKSHAERIASSRDIDKEAAFADKWRERYFDEKYLPEKQAFLKSRGWEWGEKDKE